MEPNLHSSASSDETSILVSLSLVGENMRAMPEQKLIQVQVLPCPKLHAIPEHSTSHESLK